MVSCKFQVSSNNTITTNEKDQIAFHEKTDTKYGHCDILTLSQVSKHFKRYKTTPGTSSDDFVRSYDHINTPMMMSDTIMMT